MVYLDHDSYAAHVREMHGTGVGIPRDLFSNIIWYICSDGPRKYFYDEKLPSDMLSSALVCVFWAEECRRLMYRDIAVNITTMAQAVRFRDIVTGSAKHKQFTPIGDLIKSVDVTYSLKDGEEPWFHVVGLLAPHLEPHKLGKLFFTTAKNYHDNQISPIYMHTSRTIRSLYWNIPRSLPSFATPYRKVMLYELHFASTRTIVTIVRQFKLLRELELSRLTWDHDTPADVQWAPCDPPTKDFLSSIKVERCKDNVSLFRQLWYHGPSPNLLQTLSNADQETLHMLIDGMEASHKKMHRYSVPYVTCNLSVSGEHRPTSVLSLRLSDTHRR